MLEVEIETKKEYRDSLCITCLSFGRKMFTVGNNTSTHKILLSDFLQIQSLPEETSLCWECSSTLQKFIKFQNQVKRANQLLQNGQSHVYGTLSTLSTVIKTDTEPHTIYFNESSINIKQEVLTEECPEDNDIDSYEDSFKDCEEIPNDTPISTVKDEIVGKEKKPNKINNRWSKKRALQNKKPKFKMLKAKDVDVNIVFKEFQSKTMERLECINCCLKFNSDNLLMEHYKKFHEKDLVCNICFILLADETQFSDHIKTHTERYECKLCGYNCATECNGRKHLMSKHNKIYRCVYCELLFVSRRDFFKHYKSWHEKFVCDYCGVTFKMRYCIKDHIRKQHSPFECKPCNKRFARYNGLWLHNKVAHTETKQTAYCVECDKRYPDVYRYKWHLANSVKHKPKKKVRIPCPDCDKFFSKNIYMKDHYNLVHLKQYKYRCEECDKNFIRNADLVKHKKRVHEGILPPKNKICYMCGRGFTTNKILTNHLRTHTGERPFVCNTCPARFAQRTALAGHEKALHQNETNT